MYKYVGLFNGKRDISSGQWILFDIIFNVNTLSDAIMDGTITGIGTKGFTNWSNNHGQIQHIVIELPDRYAKITSRYLMEIL